MNKSSSHCVGARGLWASVLVSALAFSVSAADLPAPIIWWDMEAVSNGKIADRSGNGRDLTLSTGASLTNGFGGANSSALFIDGTRSGYATFSSPALGSRTIAYWIRRCVGAGPIGWAGGNTYPYVFTGFSSLSMHFSNNSDYNIDTSIFAGNTQQNPSRYFTQGGLPKIHRETWTHVAITFDVTNTVEESSSITVSHITYKAYLNGIIRLGGLFAGLLSNAGIGMLVLFRSNRNMRENFIVVCISYVLSALTGAVIGLLF